MDYKFIPIYLKDFVIHNQLANQLLNIDSENPLNMIFYGIKNSGKQVLVNALLNHIYKTDINLSKSMNNTEIKIGNNKVNIDYMSSNYHIELNLYECGLYDKNIASDFLEDYIKYKPIHTDYRYIIINHFDHVSILAQQIFRKILDSPHCNSKFIFIANSISNLDKGIISRLSKVRVPKPTKQNISNYIDHISKTSHKISKLHKKELVKHSKNDLFTVNSILYYLQYNKKPDFSKINIIDNYIQEIICYITEPNIQSILKIRKVCYHMLLINVKMIDIIKSITNYYMDSNILLDENKFRLVQMSASVQHSQVSIEHDIICVEYFILKVKKLLLHN